jgi:hypothetical protein
MAYYTTVFITSNVYVGWDMNTYMGWVEGNNYTAECAQHF